MKNRIIVFFFVAVILSGCASAMKTTYGSKNITPENINKIIKGKTTQVEILKFFGEPMSKMQAGVLGTMWTYSLSKTKRKSNFFASDYEAHSYALTVTFGDDGIVKDYTYIETNPMQPLEISYE